MDTMDDRDLLGIFSLPALGEKPWATYAACRDGSGMTFFPQTKREEAAAIAICNTCAVREECLDHAIATNERFGIWGGTTEKQRRELARIR